MIHLLGQVAAEMQKSVAIKLTKVNAQYSVVLIINRDSRMISKLFSSHSSFPYIRGYANAVRIARCYVFRRVW